MSEIFIHITRGKVVECMHRGDAVVVDASGTIIAKAADPYKYTYLRSSAKPIQAMNLILSGAADRYGISDRELAICCASHYAEPMHLETVRSMLAKAGMGESQLQSGKALSINPVIAMQQAAVGLKPQRILSDCSGKHSGMLITCKHRSYPIESYLDPHHPVQQEILGILADICSYPKSDIAIGIDGCNVPVFAMPIYNMALGFIRRANPELLPLKYREAAHRIFCAMNEHPEMVGGTGSFCTALMQSCKGNMIGKVGAQGVYCIGIKEPRLGIALKIEDGGVGIAPMAAMQILVELGVLSDKQYQSLKAFHKKPNLNDDNQTVGEIYPIFQLDK